MFRSSVFEQPRGRTSFSAADRCSRALAMGWNCLAAKVIKTHGNFPRQMEHLVAPLAPAAERAAAPEVEAPRRSVPALTDGEQPAQECCAGTCPSKPDKIGLKPPLACLALALAAKSREVPAFCCSCAKPLICEAKGTSQGI